MCVYIYIYIYVFPHTYKPSKHTREHCLRGEINHDNNNNDNNINKVMMK